ncbi:MAG: CRISPR-associated helicase Cas3' [Desulfobacula sp.]|jgi:CRISPR-associated endonuclease/helicase Cas3
MDDEIIKTWAKTISDGSPGISVIDHCRNVGWVAYYLAEYRNLKIIDSSLDYHEISSLSAAHDIGKHSKGFSCKSKMWLERELLFEKAMSERWEDMNSNHGQLSQYSIYQVLKEAGLKKRTAKDLSIISGAHHGKIFQVPPSGDMDNWESQRQIIIRNLWEEFKAPKNITLSKESPALPVLMGLTSVADWIGSDESFFPSDVGLKTSACREQAKKALKLIGFQRSEILNDLSFKNIFTFDSNELQEQCIRTITRPGLYIIEAPMGLGKTEAALACAYNLLSQGKATGLYFALPTQITSNRIHRRVQEFIKRISPNNSETRLIHGNSWLMPEVYQPDMNQGEGDEDKYNGVSWFASSKRALLSSFGVGTVDQALLGVVPVKHWFVRHFALMGKVVVIDEVHSYDLYTGTLIKSLCDKLVEIGCTVILLSATMLPELRNRFLGGDDHQLSNDYPLITGKPNHENCIEPVVAKAPDKPKVKVCFKMVETILGEVVGLALKGTKILWVCNTVDRAQNVYVRIKDKLHGHKIDVGLLHSRFPYFKREELENYWLEKFGYHKPDNQGCILVSTQIVEQSVDIDADLLISELAPTDMLLQRIGRLWRHLEERPPEIRPVSHPEIWILEESVDFDQLTKASPENIKTLLGKKAKVYYPYVLLRSLQVWKNCNGFLSLPADIRTLLTETYRKVEEEPEAWAILFQEVYGEDKAKQFMAEMNTRIWNRIEVKDEEGKETRLVSLETRSLVLLKTIDSDHAVLLNGETIHPSHDHFSIRDARAIHRNIVKVHAWPFVGQPLSMPFEKYVRGIHQAAIVFENGSLQVDGINTLVSTSLQTKEKKMNLVTDPWLPVINSHNQGGNISLQRLFSKADEWKDLNLYPHERISVMRFLICLVQAALDGPEDLDDLDDDFQAAVRKINEYLSEWKPYFNLFDSNKPFLQVNGLVQVGQELTAVTKLDSMLSTGNNSTLLDHGANIPKKEGPPRPMDVSKIAVSLLTFENFSLGGLFPQVRWNGILTGKAGVKDAPCASQSMLHSFIRRETLVKTVFSNMVTPQKVNECYGNNGWGKPIWEWMPQGFEDEDAVFNATRTYLGRLTPLSRLVRINGDLSTMLMGEGLRYPVPPDFIPEPTATQVLKNTNERRLLSIKAKAPWRELHALTIKRNSDGLGGPIALSNLPENQPYDLLIAAMKRKSGQDNVLDIIESVFHIPASLTAESGRATYEKEVKYLEQMSFNLSRAVNTYRNGIDSSWKKAVKENRNLKSKLDNKAFAIFWTRIEGELDTLFSYVGSLGEDADKVRILRAIWRKYVGRIIRESYEILCGRESARQLKAFVAGLKDLFPESDKQKEQTL